MRREKELEEVVRLMLRVIYQAAEVEMEISPQDVAYFDVSTGEVIKGCQTDSRLSRTIEGGCAVLEELINKKIA